MSLSGSSASRNSIWAMTRLASSSSMNVGRKMIRSLRRREKMSNARSPRGVCSMTIGTRAMPLSFVWGDYVTRACSMSRSSVLRSRSPCRRASRSPPFSIIRRPLGAWAQLAHDLAVVPLDAVGVHALPAQALPGVLDLVGHLAHDHGLRYAELVAGQQRVHHLVLEGLARLGLAPGLELPAHLGPQRVERVELAQGLGEVVVDRRQQLLLDLAQLEAGGA